MEEEAVVSTDGVGGTVSNTINTEVHSHQSMEDETAVYNTKRSPHTWDSWRGSDDQEVILNQGRSPSKSFVPDPVSVS